MAGRSWPSAASREHRRGPSKPWRRLTWCTWLLVIGLCCCCCCSPDTASAQETEGRGGANAGGPSGQPSTAHLSDAERQQLLQVHQSILQSPDPQQALVQVAEANEMSPQQLAELLNQNAADAQQQGGLAGGGGGGGGGATFQGGWPKAAGKALTSLWLVVVQYAKTNPKAFGVACTAALLVLYTMVTAPRWVSIVLCLYLCLSLSVGLSKTKTVRRTEHVCIRMVCVLTPSPYYHWCACFFLCH